MHYIFKYPALLRCMKGGLEEISKRLGLSEKIVLPLGQLDEKRRIEFCNKVTACLEALMEVKEESNPPWITTHVSRVTSLTTDDTAAIAGVYSSIGNYWIKKGSQRKNIDGVNKGIAFVKGGLSYASSAIVVRDLLVEIAEGYSFIGLRRPELSVQNAFGYGELVKKHIVSLNGNPAAAYDVVRNTVNLIRQGNSTKPLVQQRRGELLEFCIEKYQHIAAVVQDPSLLAKIMVDLGFAYWTLGTTSQSKIADGIFLYAQQVALKFDQLKRNLVDSVAVIQKVEDLVRRYAPSCKDTKRKERLGEIVNFCITSYEKLSRAGACTDNYCVGAKRLLLSLYQK